MAHDTTPLFEKVSVGSFGFRLYFIVSDAWFGHCNKMPQARRIAPVYVQMIHGRALFQYFKLQTQNADHGASHICASSSRLVGTRCTTRT
jgi:hypothetical protein